MLDGLDSKSPAVVEELPATGVGAGVCHSFSHSGGGDVMKFGITSGGIGVGCVA